MCVFSKLGKKENELTKQEDRMNYSDILNPNHIWRMAELVNNYPMFANVDLVFIKQFFLT